MFKRNERVLQVPISQIIPCPYQPRKVMDRQALQDLSQNIKENGILQPLTATKTSDGRYRLIAGHRRLLASDMAGLSSVPVVLLDKTDEEVAVLSVIENLQREDLNFFEQAQAIQMLMEKLNLTQAQVGKKLSMSQPAIANKLRILQFSEKEQRLILTHHLTERHARRIIRLPDEKRLSAIRHIVSNNLNVSQCDRYIDSLLSPKERHSQKRTIKIKDLRLFTNTIKKRIKVMQSAGVNTTFTQNEDDEYIRYQILVPKV